MAHHTPPCTRLLLLDGSPGATALLLMAAHGAMPRFDAVLVPNTRWEPKHSRQDLNTLARLATDAGMRWIHAPTGDTQRDVLEGVIMPLPLHTLTADGVRGRLPQVCAHRQGVALSTSVRRLLGHPRPYPVPQGAMARCATGATLDHTRDPLPSGPPYLRFHRPLIDIGWTKADCAALVAYHGLPRHLDLACLACPQRSNTAWRHLRQNSSAEWDEAVAVDATVRHGHPDPASRGMPPGTTFHLHPDRLPLEQADLSPNTDPHGCLPWSGNRTPQPNPNGDGR